MDGRESVSWRYAEHLTDHDPLILAGGRADQAAALRREPTLVLDLLDRPTVAVVAARREEAGRFSYERAGDGVPRAVVETPRSARRVLTLVADRYLFPVTSDWLPAPGA
jgi:hypothetical protein